MTDNPKKLPDFDCSNDLHGPYYNGELIRFMGKFDYATRSYTTYGTAGGFYELSRKNTGLP